MKYIRYTTQEAAEPARVMLNELLGYDDGKGTVHATGPAVLRSDGFYYLTVRKQWLDLFEDVTVVDSFERPVFEDE